MQRNKFMWLVLEVQVRNQSKQSDETIVPDENKKTVKRNRMRKKQQDTEDLMAWMDRIKSNEKNT